jgi:hypothetical protein
LIIAYVDYVRGKIQIKEVAMSRRRVVKVVNSNTIEIEPDWLYKSQQGNLLQINGYKLPPVNSIKHETIIKRLNNLIVGKTIVMGTVLSAKNGVLHCDVFIDGYNLSDYFSDFQ